MKNFLAKLGHLSAKRRVVLGLLIGIFFIEDIVLAVNNLQNKTPILGLKLNSHLVTNLTRPQIEKLVQSDVSFAKPLSLFYQDKSIQVKPGEIGAKVDPTLVANQALEYGRKGSFIEKIIKQTKALLGLESFKIDGKISQSLLTLKILQIQDQIDQEVMPAMPDFTHNLKDTIPAKEAVKVNTDKLTVLIADNIFNPQGDKIEIPTIKTYSKSSEKDLAAIRQEVPSLVKQPISITSGGLTFTLSNEDLLSFLTVVERVDPKDPKKTILLLRLDDKKFNRKLGEFASQVEKVTGAEFDDHDARVAVYSQFYSKKRSLIAIPTGRRLTDRVLGLETLPGLKVAYLTFDDGPNSIYHPMILDILKAYDIKATFFLVGLNSQRDLEVAKRTVADGHVVGNHSLTHSFLPQLSSRSILKEIKDTEDILKQINNNQQVTLFRPPYGGVNLTVKQRAQDLGVKLTLWDVDPRDWSEPPTDELVRRVVDNVQNGSDILLHSNHLATVKALPKIIEGLKAKGFSFQTLN